MKSGYIKNTLILSVCTLISKLLGAVYRIPLSNILGTIGIGIYQIVFPVYSLFLVFITGAMPTYVAQKVASYRAKNDSKLIAKLIKNAVFISFVMGLLFLFFLSGFSKIIAKSQNSAEAYLGYIILAMSIVFSAVTSVYKGYFQGKENMFPTAISGIIEQLTKLAIGLGLSLYCKRFGVLYAVYGAFLGVFISEIVCFLYMFFNFKKQKLELKRVFINYKQCKSVFFQFLPISLSGLVLPISSCIDSFIVVNLLTFNGTNVGVATSLFGIATGMINPLINFPIILCGTLATAFLPVLTYKISQKEDIKQIVGETYFFVWFLCLPCITGIIALAPNIIEVFFPVIEYSYKNISSYYLSISTFNIIWISISQISTSILNGYEKFKLPFFSQLIALILKVIIFIVLVTIGKLGILSLCFATTISNSVSCIINLVLAKKICSFNIKFKKLILCIINAFIMFSTIHILNLYLTISIFLKTVLLVCFGVILYLFLAIIFKVISISKIKEAFLKSRKELGKV